MIKNKHKWTVYTYKRDTEGKFILRGKGQGYQEDIMVCQLCSEKKPYIDTLK